ncbi:hypothetical protein [Mesorhizobium sp. BE184]|uniref:hypothetical protein n=1 Tax=Mesorhizobium sp. BE184 TaxID=2817714 RepID=UPI0028623870|nr:hypothetical protein [Mesorhizobium sp. BE184]MDR7032498.1 hypothetical protein [Mesorhizobium sp. BE184]
MSATILTARACAFVLAAFVAGYAHAGEKPVSGTLPGVEGDYRIVKPAEPEPDLQPAEDGRYKVGNFDVRISGFVRAEAGFGNEFELKKK